MHDHTYGNQSGTVQTLDENVSLCNPVELPNMSESDKLTAEDILQGLHLDKEERDLLEEKSRILCGFRLARIE